MAFTQKEIAEVYRLGLIVGLFEVKEAVSWADSVIAAEADPDYALIEVSMAGDANEGKMAQLLADVKGEADPKRTRGVVFGLLSKRLAADAGALDGVTAQVKALEKSEGKTQDIGDDLAASLRKFEPLAAEWSSR